MVPQDSELIFVMGGTNDLGQVMRDLAWVAVSVVDTAWAADATYYNGGDFNISSFKGAVASTILKLQIWCPNARLVFASPLSGRGTTSGVNMTEPVYTNGFTTKDYRDAIEEVAEVAPQVAGLPQPHHRAAREHPVRGLLEALAVRIAIGDGPRGRGLFNHRHGNRLQSWARH